MDKTVVLLSDVLNQASKDFTPLVEADITANCSVCGPVSVATASIASSGRETRYSCATCGAILVVIGPVNPDGQPWPGRGYRLNDFVVRNAVDLIFRAVKLPASPAALAEKRPQQ